MFSFLTIIISILCGSAAWALVAEYVWGNGLLYATLPLFTGTAAAAAGILIAAMEYRAAKKKKQKRFPLFALIYDAFAGIAATAIWLYVLLL